MFIVLDWMMIGHKRKSTAAANKIKNVGFKLQLASESRHCSSDSPKDPKSEIYNICTFSTAKCCNVNFVKFVKTFAYWVTAAWPQTPVSWVGVLKRTFCCILVYNDNEVEYNLI